MQPIIRTYGRLLKSAERFTQVDLSYVLGGGSWLFLGQVIGMITAILLAVGYAHFLPKETYGTYKYLLSILGILSLFSLSGMDGAVQRGIAQGKEAIFWKTFRLRVKFSSFAIIACLGIGFYYLNAGNGELATLFFVSAPFLILLEPLTHYNSLLTGKKLFRKASILSIVLQISSALIMLAVIYYTKNPLGIILAYLSGTLLLRGCIFLYVTTRHPLNHIEDPDSLNYGKHWTIMSVVGTISSRLDAIVLFHFLGPAPLAVYSFAQAAVLNIQNSFKLITTNLAFPKMAAQDKEVIKKTLLRKVRIAHYITIPISVLAIFVIPSFFQLFFPKYLDSIPYAQVMTGLLAFAPLRLISTAITAKASLKTYYTLTITSSLLGSIGLIVCVPVWGIWGAIIALGAQQSISNLFGLYLFKRM